MNSVQKLLSIASPPLAPSGMTALCLRALDPGRVYVETASMLTTRNGFAAFESALVIRPSIDTELIMGLDSWNMASGWRRYYVDIVPQSAVFFAEDIFAGQFGALANSIIRLDPESGEVTRYADSLEGWAERLLANYAEDTGWPLGHAWQLANGPLPAWQRLLPKQPFILGGDFAVENLTAVDSSVAMENWGRLRQATRSVPDGQQITVSGWLA